MTRQHVYTTNFAGGEVDPRLLGRGDLQVYTNGARELTNVRVHATGGVERRPGLRFLHELPGQARLVPFEFSVDESYLLAFTSFRLDVFRDGVLETGHISAPWHKSLLSDISWVQSADTLIVTHPDVVPRLITRDAAGTWHIDQLKFAQVGPRHMAPYARIAPPGVTLDPAGTTGSGVRIVASADVFSAGHQGARLRLHGGEALITQVVDARNVDVEITVDLASDAPTRDWVEAAYSQAHGYPEVAAFHQNRLVLGGGKATPNHLFLSKTEDLFNFDPGTGLDDEAIHFALLSDQVNAVRGLLSAGELLVFTSGGEWRVTGDPLTPTSVQVKRQTEVGARADRWVAPKIVDGAALFVSRHGGTVSSFAYAESARGYRTEDLTLLARHLVQDVVEIDAQPARRQLFCVLGNGTVAMLTQVRSEGVAAWSRLVTDGQVHALAVVDDRPVLLVERSGGWMLEQLDPGLLLDSAVDGTADPPASVWSGLDHLEGRQVQVVADGQVETGLTVTGGAIELDAPAAAVAIGLPYTHVVEPLPPLAANAQGTGHAIKVRLVEATFRLHDTAALSVDTGAGPRPVPFTDPGDPVPDPPIPPYSGDRSVRALGWRPAGTEPLWRIEGDQPLAMTLLSITTEMKVND
jgi:hypothetical protein